MQGNIIILDINSDDMLDFMGRKNIVEIISYLLIYLALNLWVDK